MTKARHLHKMEESQQTQSRDFSELLVSTSSLSWSETTIPNKTSKEEVNNTVQSEEYVDKWLHIVG